MTIRRGISGALRDSTLASSTGSAPQLFAERGWFAGREGRLRSVTERDGRSHSLGPDSGRFGRLRALRRPVVERDQRHGRRRPMLLPASPEPASASG